MQDWKQYFFSEKQTITYRFLQYQPIAICETYQTDSAELLKPSKQQTDEMEIDNIYQSL